MMDEDEDINDIFDDDLDNIVENKDDEGNEESNINVANNDQDDNTQTARRVEVKKRVVRNPRVTLNAQRLCGERGIAILPKAFENIQFKGKGHEKEDLDKLMSILKHWSYRLFPSMCFSDVLETTERLGKKKQVQVCLKKIRLGMPVLSEDFVRDDSDDDDINRNISDTAEMSQDATNNNMDPFSMPGTSKTVLNEDAFDELIKEHEQYMDMPVMRDSETINADHLLLNYFPARTSVASPERIRSLTEEQKERIERNAKLARERKAQSKSIQPVGDHIRNELDLNVGGDLDSSLHAANTIMVSNTSLVHSSEELGFRNHSECDLSSTSANASECHNIDFKLPSSSKTFNLNNSDSETLSCIKSKTHEHEAMFSSDESNDDIKLDITTDALLKCSEQHESEGSSGIIE